MDGPACMYICSTHTNKRCYACTDMKVVWCVVVLEEKRSKCHADNVGSRSVDMMFICDCTPI
jgi:hypothetical protein